MTLRAIVIEVEIALSQVPEAADFYGGSWIEAHRKRSAELERLVIAPLRRDRGLVVRPGIGRTEVTLGGIRATSTGGVSGALTNWCRAARRHLDEQS